MIIREDHVGVLLPMGMLLTFSNMVWHSWLPTSGTCNQWCWSEYPDLGIRICVIKVGSVLFGGNRMNSIPWNAIAILHQNIVLVQFILFFLSSWCKIASAARNWINSVPKQQWPLPSRLYISFFCGWHKIYQLGTCRAGSSSWTLYYWLNVLFYSNFRGECGFLTVTMLKKRGLCLCNFTATVL